MVQDKDQIAAVFSTNSLATYSKLNYLHGLSYFTRILRSSIAVQSRILLKAI